MPSAELRWLSNAKRNAREHEKGVFDLISAADYDAWNRLDNLFISGAKRGLEIGLAIWYQQTTDGEN